MKKTSSRNAALKHGWRSGLEEVVGAQIKSRGIEVEYETLVVPFLQPQKPRRYTPDYILPNGIVIETKGRFVTADRQKHKLVKEQHPQLEIRFVFSNSRQHISKQSETTYAAWCQHSGFQFADKLIPEAWFNEPALISRIRAIDLIKKG